MTKGMITGKSRRLLISFLPPTGGQATPFIIKNNRPLKPRLQHRFQTFAILAGGLVKE